MNDSHCIIVGGTRGMGRELAAHWANAGSPVSVLARTAGSLPGVHYFCPSPEESSIRSEIQSCIENQGPLKNLVFFQRYRDGGEPWEGELKTTLSLSRVVIEACQDRFSAEGGSIVVVSSVASDFVVPDQPVGYHVAKAGLLQMANYYAVKLGPRGVRVNTVSPSFLIKEDSRQYHTSNPTQKERFAARAPLARMGTSTDLINVIGLLCSPEASYLTGQNLVLDGGMSLLWPGAIQ